jgi:hypothetical protein
LRKEIKQNTEIINKIKTKPHAKNKEIIRNIYMSEEYIASDTINCIHVFYYLHHHFYNLINISFDFYQVFGDGQFNKFDCC